MQRGRLLYRGYEVLTYEDDSGVTAVVYRDKPWWRRYWRNFPVAWIEFPPGGWVDQMNAWIDNREEA